MGLEEMEEVVLRLPAAIAAIITANPLKAVEFLAAEVHKITSPSVAEDTREYTGKSVSYYRILVTNPTSPDQAAYIAECNDIIEALGMNYAEGNILKALWRLCAARKGLSKRGYIDGAYDAEKIVFFGERELVIEKNRAGK